MPQAPCHPSALNPVDTINRCIAGPQDAVLIPGPIYPAFLNDLQVGGQKNCQEMGGRLGGGWAA